MLEKTQKADLDITDWLHWFLICLVDALESTNRILENVLNKAQFWNNYSQTVLNERQRLIINQLLDGFFGKLTSSKWAKMSKCSSDTALRDIQDLMQKGILRKQSGGGRSTNYELLGINEKREINGK